MDKNMLEQDTTKALARTHKGAADLAPKGTPADLDVRVREVHEAKAAGARAFWELGRKVAAIHDDQLWKLRVGEDGAPVHKSFAAFCLAELKMTPTNALSLMDVASKFDSETVGELGPTKCALMLKAPPEVMGKLAMEAKQQNLTGSQVKQRVNEEREAAGFDGRRDTGRKPMPAGKPHQVNKIVIAQILRNEVIQLKCKADPQAPARNLRDAPVGYLDLAAGVRQFFAIGESTTGTLVLYVTTKRLGDGDKAKAEKPEKQKAEKPAKKAAAPKPALKPKAAKKPAPKPKAAKKPAKAKRAK